MLLVAHRFEMPLWAYTWVFTQMCMELMTEQIFVVCSHLVSSILCVWVCVLTFFVLQPSMYVYLFQCPNTVLSKLHVQCHLVEDWILWSCLSSCGPILLWASLLFVSFSSLIPCFLVSPMPVHSYWESLWSFLSPSPFKLLLDLTHFLSTVYHKTLTCMWIFSFINVACL